MAINITRTSEMLPTVPAKPRPVVPHVVPPVESPTRAVVVRVDGEQAHHFERQCLKYLDRHGLRLVGFADSEGAMGMIAGGTADLVVAAREQHIGRPWFVRIVADEAREPGKTDPRLRRPRRRNEGTTVSVTVRRPMP